MQTSLALRAVARPEAAAVGRAARRLSAVRAPGAHSPPFQNAFAASPARQAVVARDSIASLESYSDAPPLDVVPWTKEAANTVTLTGTVGAVDVRRLSTGKTKASIRLAVRNRAAPGEAEPDTDWCAAPPAHASRHCTLLARGCGYFAHRCGCGCRRNWAAVADSLGSRLGHRPAARRRFDVEVWNELAEQVAEHAPKGSRLVVSGKLVQDKCARSGGLAPVWLRSDARASPPGGPTRRRASRGQWCASPRSRWPRWSRTGACERRACGARQFT